LRSMSVTLSWQASDTRKPWRNNIVSISIPKKQDDRCKRSPCVFVFYLSYRARA
jgi:hypothetical protein